MNYYFQSAKITAPQDDRRWGSCFVENDLMVLLEIETDNSKPASQLGKSVLDTILLEFQNKTVKDKNTVKSLLKEISGNPYLKTVIIALNSGSDLFLGCLGKGQAVLIRNEKSGTIISGGFISQGEITFGDQIIFHSDRLASVLDAVDLDKLYHTGNLQQIEEELAARLSSDVNATGCAVLAVIVTEKKVDVSADLPVRGSQISVFVKNILQSGFFKKFYKIRSLFGFYYSIKDKKKRFLISLVTVLFIFLLLNIGISILRSKNSQKVKEINNSLETVKGQYDEALALIELNPVRSRELLSSAKMAVGNLLKTTGKKTREYKLLSDWFNKISSSEVDAYKIYKLTAVPLFFDITLIKPGGIGNDIAYYQEKKVILDKKNKTVYFLDTKTKEAKILAGIDTVKNAVAVSVHGSYVYVFNDEGIYRIDIVSKDSKKVIERDKNWTDISDMEAYAGNLYLLDRGSNSVWKYIAAEEGFSDRISYVNKGVSADLRSMAQISIDGSVWAAGSSGIIKFTSGNRDIFSFADFSETVTGIDAISTSDENNYLYLLDKTLERIIIFDKEGVYNSQYQWPDLKNADGLAASEKEGKIYILIKDKIHAIDLK